MVRVNLMRRMRLEVSTLPKSCGISAVAALTGLSCGAARRLLGCAYTTEGGTVVDEALRSLRSAGWRLHATGRMRPPGARSLVVIDGVKGGQWFDPVSGQGFPGRHGVAVDERGFVYDNLLGRYPFDAMPRGAIVGAWSTKRLPLRLLARHVLEDLLSGARSLLGDSR